jgi:hypothetical protein
MEEQEEKLTGEQSLALITQMIARAKQKYYDTGLSAMMWGAVIALCSLEKLAEIHFGYRLPFDIYMFTFVAVIPQIMISIKENRERKVKTQDDVTMDYLWLAFGISIILMMLVVNNVSRGWGTVFTDYQKLSGHLPSFRFYEFIPSLFLLLYGLPTFVTGASFKFKPMIWGGILCWVCCIVAVYTTIKIDLLLTAFSAVCAWLIPGIIIRGEYRKAKRGLKQVNV